MVSINEYSLGSSLRREDNIYKMISLIKRGTDAQVLLKELAVKPATIYKYLLSVQEAQFQNERYLVYLGSVFPKDAFAMKEMTEWRKRANKQVVKAENEQFLQDYDEKFYEELHYFLLVFKYLK